jgi:hypothetical protein
MKCSDQSRWYRSVLGFVAVSVAATIVMIAPPRAHAACTGDCSGDGEVTVNELITMVNIALGTAQVSTCTAGDVNGDGEITVNEIIAGVNSALNGCTPAAGGCGDGVVEAGEDCDNGGTCIGGSDAGKSCKGDSECDQSGGVCLDGPKRLFGCSSNADCPSSTCVHCKTFGGKGCAANCTTESPVNITLVPGDSDGTNLVEGTSGLLINSGIGITVGIAFPANTTRQLLVGKEKDGKVPAALPALTNGTPGINVLGAACICTRPVVFESCGGTVWDKSGVPSINCSAGYTAGGSVCDSIGKPCTFVYGPDNAGAGVVGCDSLDGINLTVTQDAGGSTGTSHPPVTTMSDAGGPGSAVLSVALELGFTLNPCTGSTPEYGDDGQFCTADDPQAGRAVLPQILTTGSASATVLNADLNDGLTVPEPPIIFSGNPLSCATLASGSASGGALAGAFTDLNASPEIQDIVVNSAQVAQ